MKRSVLAAAVAAFTAVALTACSTGKSLEGGEEAKGSAASSKIVVGSQDYYSNEILAEVYAQALEGSGFTVERQLRIGQREVYMPELESRNTRATCSSTSIKTRVLVRMLRFTRRWAERCPRGCAYWTKPPQPTKTPMLSPLLSLPSTLSAQLVTWRTLDRSLLAVTLSLRRVRMDRRDWNRNTV